MAKWSMVIDLDKCVACQGCSIACRFENNTAPATPEQAAIGRSMFWNEVFPLLDETNDYAQPRYIPRPCMHCENPPCIKVCPVGATYQDEEGIVHQNYARCIGCRLCTVGCPYTVRYFNWTQAEWETPLAEHLNPDRVESSGLLEGPAPRPRGVVEKCTYCFHRIDEAKKRIEKGEDIKIGSPDGVVPACVEACPTEARFFGDLDDPKSQVSELLATRSSFKLREEMSTDPKTIYLPR